MATRKKGLGRGLDSMIPNKLPEEKKEIKTATKKSPAEEVPTTGGKIMLDINLVEIFIFKTISLAKKLQYKTYSFRASFK